MTLIGKIFRPWDLAANETFVSNSSDSMDSVGTRGPLKQTKIDSGKISHVTIPGKSKTSEHSSDESGTERCRSVTSAHSIKVEKNRTQQTVEQHHPNVPFYLPSSPVTPTSSSFMSSPSINELASLSRSELTAMGLLPPEPPASMKVKRQRPKRFRCPHCQVAFSNNGQLRGHIRIHTGERPFACEHEGCGKSFTRNEELTRHRRIHTGLRPYPCTHCGKKFGRKDHLKKHTRTHQRPMYNASSGMIGLGNPFHPFNPSLIPSHSAINEFGSLASPYSLPFMLSIPPPISHFPFS